VHGECRRGEREEQDINNNSSIYDGVRVHGASDAGNEAVWPRKFIIELGVFPSMHDLVILFCEHIYHC
jgi:hypothetical protein